MAQPRKLELEERMQQFGLEMNSQKTRLIEFGRFAMENRAKRGEGKPETFDFLGFMHICAKTWKDGYLTVKRKSISRRLRRKVREVGEKLRTSGPLFRLCRSQIYRYHTMERFFHTIKIETPQHMA